MSSLSRTCAPVRLFTCFVGLLMTVPARAQVVDVVDAPVAFYNATDTDLTIEGISVLRRDGADIPINLNWHFKAGQCSWLVLNNQKIPGVTFTFVLRTPGGNTTAWTTHSQGASADGHFIVHLTKEQLQAHLQTLPTLGETPVIASAAERRRQFFQHQIARVQAAIQQDEDFVMRNHVATGVVRGLGEGIDAYGKRSDDPTDALVGAIFNGLTKGVANAATQDRVAAQSRIAANRQLLQRYFTEMNALPVLR